MGRLGVVGHVFETNRGDWGEEGHRGAHVAFTLGRVALSASCRVPLTVCMAGRMNRPDKNMHGEDSQSRDNREDEQLEADPLCDGHVTNAVCD